MLKIDTFHTVNDGTVTFYYDGARTFLDCPTTPVNINLELMSCWGAPLGENFTGGVISWTATVDANLLMVNDAAGGSKWWIVSLDSDIGFPSPVTYGMVPAGAQQAIPPAGTPPPAIASGDTIAIYPIDYLIPYAGEMCFPGGNYTVP
jgi:hypothetical protein